MTFSLTGYDDKHDVGFVECVHKKPTVNAVVRQLLASLGYAFTNMEEAQIRGTNGVYTIVKEGEVLLEMKLGKRGVEVYPKTDEMRSYLPSIVNDDLRKSLDATDRDLGRRRPR